MAREERADSILGGTDEFIASIDRVLFDQDQRSRSPAYGRLIGRLEQAVKRDNDDTVRGGLRGRIGRLDHARWSPSRRS